MISRVSTVVIKQIEDYVRAQARWVGLLEHPPVDMSHNTEVRSQGYRRYGIQWTSVRDGFLVVDHVCRFTGLDAPVTVMALGLYPNSGTTAALTAWGALEEPLKAVNGNIDIGANTISFRIA